MSSIMADATTLMEQASMTSHDYLLAAIKNVDKLLGEGYAKKNPHLLAAMIKVSGADFNNSILVKDFTNAIEDLSYSIGKIADALEVE